MISLGSSNRNISSVIVGSGSRSRAGSTSRIYNYCSHNSNDILACVFNTHKNEPTPPPTNVPFVLVFEFNNDDDNQGGNYVELPLSNVNTDLITIDWGDGTVIKGGTDYSHTFLKKGTYTVTISDDFTIFSPNGNPGDIFPGRSYVSEIVSFNSSLVDLQNSFRQQNTNIINKNIKVPSFLPSSVTNISGMFRSNYVFNDPNISSWNVSNVKDMSLMFYRCYIFNQPLNWNVSNVENMYSMFASCNNFNQLLNWNVSNVENMNNMFNNCYSFNQPLNWNVSKVENMSNMFTCCIFNQDIGNWDIRNVTNGSNIGIYGNSDGGLSVDNYSKILKGWASLAQIPQGIVINVDIHYKVDA